MTPKDFKDQVKQYCPNCSASLPMDIPNNHEQHDFTSPSNAARLEKIGSPKYNKGRIKIQDMKKLSDYLGNTDGTPGPHRGSFKSHPQWTPWNYRSEVWHEPGEGTLKASEVRTIQTGG